MGLSWSSTGTVKPPRECTYRETRDIVRREIASALFIEFVTESFPSMSLCDAYIESKGYTITKSNPRERVTR